MIDLETFAIFYLPIGFLVEVLAAWVVMHIYFDKETITLEDIIICYLFCFLIGLNMVFMLWGMTLL